MYGNEGCNIGPTNQLSGGMALTKKADVIFDRVINARNTSERIISVIDSINSRLFGPSPACDEQCSSPAPCIEYVVDEANGNLNRIEKALADICNRL